MFGFSTIRKISLALVAIALWCSLSAQEFKATVSVNPQKLFSTSQQYESTDNKVFEAMQQALDNFINQRRWTNITFEQYERIECSFSIVLNRRTSATNFEGQLSMQMRRPVYNSSYTTGLFNFMEKSDLQFAYNDNQPLEFDINTFYSNLSSTVAYYLYIMLGVYFDSFAQNGGDAFFETARQIAQISAQSVEAGWSSKSDSRARYWFSADHTNSAMQPLHDAYYKYHRLGLDMMSRNQPEARQQITAALMGLTEVGKQRAMVLSVSQFIDVKLAEIISIFTPAPEEEKRQIYAIVKQLAPAQISKLKEWNIKE